MCQAHNLVTMSNLDIEKLSQFAGWGKLTPTKKSKETGSRDEGYHKAILDAHGLGAHARAGSDKLSGVGAAGADAGKQ
jgi:hypothetical protein